MKNTLLLLSFLLLFTGMNAQYLHHSIDASINHTDNEISVTDLLLFPPKFLKEHRTLEFTLNSKLSLNLSGKGYGIEKLAGPEGADSTAYRITIKSVKKAAKGITLIYKGKIEEEITSGAAEYARGFSQTDGIIGPDGIYMAGSTHWVPYFENATLFTFTLTVELDEPWNLVTQGTRTVNSVENGRRTVTYESPDPMDEIYLIGGEWTEYSVQAGKVLVQAFLRTADESLANRYLGVTQHYLELYAGLIGDYPFTKFALVENFWETGYGMPSFTLLGEKVIRFPWILHSSYPHELLHNYWGNSVFVDYDQGNWCEGITAYMADHLIKEQRGLGSDYRRGTLQKFTDYVNEENDFPPSEFLSRNNPAEEAVGYGKVLMFNNMLRDEFGDDLFLKAWSDFYESNKFRKASFSDIRASFEKVTGKELEPVFDQWINRTGAPSLEISDVNITEADDQYELSFSLAQVQKGDLFKLNVPVVIYLENEEEVFITKKRLDKQKITCAYKFSSRPLKISIDPQFNMMRTLHHSEVPSTLSQLFGDKKSLVIIPGESALSAGYLALAEMWSKTQAAQGKEMEIRRDSEIEEIPADRAVWVMGFENSFFDQVKISEQYSHFLTVEEREQIAALTEENTLVYALPNLNNPEQSVGFIGTHNPVALQGLSRKLFHYGGYGYLGFEGDAPDNVLKGVFPVLNSHLDHVISYPDQPEIDQTLPPREALSAAVK
ncbi:MAG: M1 family aminopeptidase [Bacteroidota bacterium]